MMKEEVAKQEMERLGISITKQIDRVINDLELMKRYINMDLVPFEHYMPQQELIDLAMRFGAYIELYQILKGTH